MKTLIFTPADSVETYESGKLVIIGAFDVVNCNQFPTLLRPFGMALKVLAEKRDYGKTYDAKVIFRKKSTRKAIIELPIQLKFPKPQPSRMAVCVSTLQFPPIMFKTPGIYVFELKVGSNVLSDTRVDVVEIQPMKKKKKKKRKKKKKK